MNNEAYKRSLKDFLFCSEQEILNITPLQITNLIKTVSLGQHKYRLLCLVLLIQEYLKENGVTTYSSIQSSQIAVYSVGYNPILFSKVVDINGGINTFHETYVNNTLKQLEQFLPIQLILPRESELEVSTLFHVADCILTKLQLIISSQYSKYDFGKCYLKEYQELYTKTLKLIEDNLDTTLVYLLKEDILDYLTEL